MIINCMTSNIYRLKFSNFLIEKKMYLLNFLLIVMYILGEKRLLIVQQNYAISFIYRLYT